MTSRRAILCLIWDISELPNKSEGQDFKENEVISSFPQMYMI